MNTPQLSVVIPAFNAAGTLPAQLDALNAQIAPPPFEVIVADNRSTDGTSRAAQAAAAGLDLRIVPAVRAQGANCARNEGARSARAPLILFVDADDRVDDHALRAVVDAFDADPSLDLAAGVPLGQDPDTFELPVSQGYLPYGISAFLAVRREVLESIDGFDEAFVGGQEEVDFCWRAQHAGFRLDVMRDARFEYVPRSNARSAFRQFRRYGETYIQLYVKHKERGLPSSSLRIERHDVPRVARSLIRLVTGDGDRIETARGLGWIVGRWKGNFRYRVWGPR